MRCFSFLSAATLAATALAQTHTDCNPLTRDGCPVMPALGSNATFYFNKTMSDSIWNITAGGVDWTQKGATFTIASRGQSPTVKSNFYILFGRVSVIMKSARGTGIVSSFILQSEDLDEIDWEFLGANTTHVLTNYFGKGNTTDFSRGKEFKSDPPQEGFHNYTIDWTKDKTEWWLDGTLLRTLKFGEALGGKNYPQTPMTVRMGSWAGGDTKNNDPGVVAWAGGETNFKDGPFIMTVQELYVEDYTSGKEYQWGDRSGSWESIKVVEGTSEAMKEILKPHGVTNHWTTLSKGAKVAILASIGGVVAIGLIVLSFCCVKQRRAGRREYLAHEAIMTKEAAELLHYKNQMAQGKFGHGSHMI
ncbi:cell wall glucanase [Delitschia confertaspora ATCC 74209]|uniref:chitinase n=1 Tax=Delitschia confertaspora ATCC 74209 TaxID=1513339 RepID=A0A9P4MW20_9PLEO|nr:cell wall glucanase [Delitschia confertaspora ATCC 74209]